MEVLKVENHGSQTNFNLWVWNKSLLVSVQPAGTGTGNRSKCTGPVSEVKGSWRTLDCWPCFFSSALWFCSSMALTQQFEPRSSHRLFHNPLPPRPPTSPEPQWFPERRQKYTLSDQIKLCEGHVGGQRQWWTDCKLTPASPSLTTSSIYLDVTTAYSKRKLQFLNSLRHHAGVEAQNISHIILWRHTHCKKQWTCS